MMRVAAECDDVPASVIEVVRNLHDCSGRYIKRVGILSSIYFT